MYVTTLLVGAKDWSNLSAHHLVSPCSRPLCGRGKERGCSSNTAVGLQDLFSCEKSKVWNCIYDVLPFVQKGEDNKCLFACIYIQSPWKGTKEMVILLAFEEETGWDRYF